MMQEMYAPVQALEQILFGHPDVAEVCVIVAPDTAQGKKALACVVLKNNAVCASDTLQQYCAERLADEDASFEIQILTALPKSPMGVVQRRQLVDMVLHNN